ncbi:MAG: hypothetical protein N2C14_32620, partial [Planctomycetales bacterium]
QNPELHRVAERFEARTGRAVLLNTSFNLHGWPIVRTAKEALEAFASSGLKSMQVGDFLTFKE